ncbi:MAG: hypothetical protein U1E65_35725 [Myxococcota bacterium]
MGPMADAGRWSAGGVAIAWAALLAPPAYADFVPERGAIDLSAATWAQGFEGAALDGVHLYHGPSAELSPAAAEAQRVHDPRRVIEGDQAIAVGGKVPIATLELPAERLRGRRVELRLWQRPEGSRLRATLPFRAGNLLVAELPLQPTGRATDDGWEEWSSGPLDGALGGQLLPEGLRVVDQALAPAALGAAGYDVDAQAILDAVSLTDLGPALVPTATCALTDEAIRCGEAGVCAFGRCADAAVMLGPWLEDPAARADYVDRRRFELHGFEGGRIPEANMSLVEEALNGMKSAPTRRDYWTLYARAIDRLGDGHAKMASASTPDRPQTGVCIYRGLADLLPGGVEAPLVFDAPSSNPIGSALRPGDVLKAIDGIPVEAWVEQAERYLHDSGDPAGRRVQLTPQLIAAASRTGAVLELSRCPTTQPCPNPRVQQIRLDLSRILSPIFQGQPPQLEPEEVPCDHRFRRPVEDSGRGRTYTYFGARTSSTGLREVQLNGVPELSTVAGYEAAIAAAFGDGPAKVLLDQRQGLGGAMETVDRISGYFLSPADLWGIELIPALDLPLGDALHRALRACAGGVPRQAGLSCATVILVLLGAGHPAPGVSAGARLAVLDGRDVSGNDYLAALLHLRRGGVTRVFGSAPTSGAFGVVWALPAYGGEASGGTIQISDSLLSSGPDDYGTNFLTTHGVVPDEVVIQRQSDLVRGVDTVLERAREWLAQ